MAAQKSLGEWNDPRPAARRMEFRVGVNLGDIFLQADGHVYGDGVNVAARLQTFPNLEHLRLRDGAYRGGQQAARRI